eukprot:356843-Chlamydomonas_euryale.AAC.1
METIIPAKKGSIFERIFWTRFRPGLLSRARGWGSGRHAATHSGRHCMHAQRPHLFCSTGVMPVISDTICALYCCLCRLLHIFANVYQRPEPDCGSGRQPEDEMREKNEIWGARQSHVACAMPIEDTSNKEGRCIE